MEINRDYESNFEQGLEQERKHSLSDENFLKMLKNTVERFHI